MQEELPTPANLPEDWPHFATYAQVAELLAISEQTLFRRCRIGSFPSPIYLGAAARFDRWAVSEMLAGSKPRGTYARKPSTRRKAGQKGGRAKARNAKRAAKVQGKRAELVDHDQGEQLGGSSSARAS